MVRVTFEIGEKDAQWFHNILPNNYYKEGYTENNALKSHKSFYQNDFVLTANGKKLNGQIQKTDFIKRTPRSSLYTGKVDTTSQASKYVVYLEIIYKIELRVIYCKTYYRCKTG